MQTYSHNLIADHKRSFNNMIMGPVPQSSTSRHLGFMEKQQQQQQPLKCPRCDSSNTKFCYYNNYSLSQPRHFCKACKRYWTRGGTLRNVPVGGGKNKRVKRPTSVVSSTPNDGPTFSSGATNPNTLSAAHLSPDISASVASNNRLSSLFYGLSYANNSDPNTLISNGLSCSSKVLSSYNSGGYGTLSALGIGGCPSSSSLNEMLINSQIAPVDKHTVQQDPVCWSWPATSFLFSNMNSYPKQIISQDPPGANNHQSGLTNTSILEWLQDMRVGTNGEVHSMGINEERKTKGEVGHGQSCSKDMEWNKQLEHTTGISDPSLYMSWSANGANANSLDPTT